MHLAFILDGTCKTMNTLHRTASSRPGWQASPWLLRLLLAGLLLAAGMRAWAQPAEPEAADYAAVTLTDVDYSFEEIDKGRGYLTALGKATNTSAQTLENPVFEARFFDASGKLIDAFNEYSFGLDLLPGQSIMVRISDTARYGAERYASAQIHLVSGSFTPAGQGREDADAGEGWRGWLTRLFWNWGPVLLLIGVWIWAIQRSHGGYQEQVLALMQEQISLQAQQIQKQAQQVAALEKIAQALEARQPGNPSTSV